MLFIFSTLVLIRHLWQLKTVVFLHQCLIRAVLLAYEIYIPFEQRSLHCMTIQIVLFQIHSICCCIVTKVSSGDVFASSFDNPIEQHVLDTNAQKQLSQTATDV